MPGQDGVAVMAVVVDRVTAVDRMRIGIRGQVVELGVVRVEQFGGDQPVIAVLHFLQEDDVRIHGLQAGTHILDARLAAESLHALVDVVRDHAQLHHAAPEVTSSPAAARQASWRTASALLLEKQRSAASCQGSHA
ncbi:hypothetical protein D3C86_1754690 [compost metagenome]